MRSNLCVIGIPKGRENRTETIFEDIMAGKFKKLTKKIITPQI